MRVEEEASPTITKASTLTAATRIGNNNNGSRTSARRPQLRPPLLSLGLIPMQVQPQLQPPPPLLPLLLVFLVLRRPCGAVGCMGWSIFEFCRTKLAYLSLARLLARLETSQERLVRGTR